MKKSYLYMVAAVSLTLVVPTVSAQDVMPAENEQMMDHGTMDHGTMDHGTMDHGTMDHGTMDHGTPIVRAVSETDDAPADGLRDPHAYSGGHDFGPYKLTLADEHGVASLLADKFEAVRTDGETAAAYDLQAWYGRTYDRAVVKAEGEIAEGDLVEARTELLWSHAIASFWDTQLGLRYDAGEGPNRTWLGVGLQGLAPYWFEVEAAGYVGEKGRTALRLHASYELLISQKLVLQPAVEANLYGKRDDERAQGAGLSDAVAGLRLRYEIRREFAPYIGVERAALFGDTADFARAAGEDTAETRVVAGLRFWF